MATDWGLIGGLGEGLKSGFQAYTQERSRQEDMRQRNLAQALQAKSAGMQLTPSGDAWEYTPDKVAEMELGKLKTQAEIDKLNKQSEGFGGDDMLKAAIAEERLLGMQERRKKLKEGKLAPAGEVSSLGEAKAAQGQLDDLIATVEENKSMVGPGAGLLTRAQGALGLGEGGRSARVMESQLSTAAQEIGRYLEGGKLTDNDIARYKKDILPTPYDDADTFRRKAENLQRRIAQKEAAKAKALRETGYSLGDYEASTPKGLIKTPTAEKTAPIKSVGGKTYRKVQGGWEEVDETAVGKR